MALVAGIVNAALYIFMVFVAGIMTNNETAWKGAVLTAALCYATYFIQATMDQSHRPTRIAAGALVWLSIVAGAYAGWFALFQG